MSCGKASPEGPAAQGYTYMRAFIFLGSSVVDMFAVLGKDWYGNWYSRNVLEKEFE